MRQGKQTTQWGPEHYVLMDASEIVPLMDKYSISMGKYGDSWCGDSVADMRRKADLGDQSLVEASDRFLSEIEDQMPVTSAWRNMDDVVGAMPNVPAFLAGHPQHMRRRERVSRDTAPLSIYMDLTSSADIDASVVGRRAVVLLALARLLVEHRAVTLWAGISQDVGMGAGTVAWRIDTVPLDLARAAYQIGATAMARRFGYGMNHAVNSAGGHWAFRSPKLATRTGQERMRMLLGNDVLYVRPIHGADPLLRDPVAWLKKTMAQYVGDNE
jgi:hypothetical protein